MVYCKKCGAMLQSGMKFCIKCGQPVDLQSQAPKQPMSPKQPMVPQPVRPQVPIMPQRPMQPQRPVMPQAHTPQSPQASKGIFANAVRSVANIS
ncbi:MULTISPECIES: zinc-ribbon domain-containing protein [Prevotella]|uniref:zinc-ribbon domain-containing protein n=1 Tax=Prevotella merdae TaxID=2079531 RepID=UPI003AB1F827